MSSWSSGRGETEGSRMGCAPVPLWGVFSAGLVGGWWLFLGCVDDLEVGNWVWENQFEPELFLRPMPSAFDF